MSPFAQEIVAPFAARIEGRAGHGEHFPPLFIGKPGRDERARTPRRLDDDDAERKPGNQPVPTRKIATARRESERHFRDRDALFDDLVVERAVLRRIGFVEPAREHGDRAAGQTRTMRFDVNAACEAGGHGIAGAPQPLRQPPRHLPPRGGSIACADKADRRRFQKLDPSAHG